MGLQLSNKLNRAPGVRDRGADLGRWTPLHLTEAARFLFDLEIVGEIVDDGAGPDNHHAEFEPCRGLPAKAGVKHQGAEHHHIGHSDGL